MFKGLPEFCFSTLPSTGETILIKRGEEGYYAQDALKDVPAEILNRRISVTKPQVQAMKMGSMFGWDIPGANPKIYTEDGRLK